jgi:hypothetical protein
MYKTLINKNTPDLYQTYDNIRGSNVHIIIVDQKKRNIFCSNGALAVYGTIIFIIIIILMIKLND